MADTVDRQRARSKRAYFRVEPKVKLPTATRFQEWNHGHLPFRRGPILYCHRTLRKELQNVPRVVWRQVQREALLAWRGIRIVLPGRSSSGHRGRHRRVKRCADLVLYPWLDPLESSAWQQSAPTPAGTHPPTLLAPYQPRCRSPFRAAASLHPLQRPCCNMRWSARRSWICTARSSAWSKQGCWIPTMQRF